MKNIIYYITKKEIKNAQLYFNNKFKNSCLFLEKNQFYFYSKKNNRKELVHVTFRIIEFNEELAKSLETILNFSYKAAMKISKEPIDKYINNDIYSEINTTINKYCYDDCHSIFYFISEIFYKYLMGHHLKNGNKRLSLMLLINLLWFFGYYLKFTKNCKDKIKDVYKSKVEEWVEKFQNQNENKNDTIIKIKEIQQWVERNVVIALNWR